MTKNNTQFDLESVSTHDANVAHIEYFDSEYYLDFFVPNYWKNPFIKEFNHSEGLPEDNDMFAWSGLEFYQPEDGYLCYVDFGTLAKNFKEQEINEENVYPYTWDIEHFISDIGVESSNGYHVNNSWIRKNYPNILNMHPEKLIDILNELLEIPQVKWPLQVFQNYQKKLDETKELEKKYKGYFK
tara:strand:+ start:318 stop:872 length:555 start_codon:yes stop_codon:yes gene_type:complete